MKNGFTRTVRTPIFAYGEGPTEKAFLKHLRATYCRGGNVWVTIDAANGISPKNVIQSAIRICSLQVYHKKFILLDTDIPWPLADINKAKKFHLELIPATPCIEGFLLSVLEPDFNPEHKKTEDCRRLFHKKYLDRHAKIDPRNYERILPIYTIELLRKQNTVLNRIITLMTTPSM